MELYVVGISAYQMWRSWQLKDLDRGNLFDIPKGHRPIASDEEIDRLTSTYGLALPIEVGVRTPRDRRNSRTFKCSTHGSSFATHQFMRVAPGLYVARPEACLLQIAKQCKPAELAYYATELCGNYAVSNSSMHKRWRPTSRMGIDSYLERAERQNGRKALLKVYPYICDLSRSPLESALALTLCLPADWGGYEFPRPQLNPRLFLPPMTPGREGTTRYPDLLWDQARLVLEYDSSKWHTDESYASDARRRNEFVAAGYTVLSVTPDQLFSIPAMEDLANTAARIIGCKAPESSNDPAVLQKRLELRSLLQKATNSETSFKIE